MKDGAAINEYSGSGVGYYQMTTDKGFRWSSSVGYLNAIFKRDNVDILCNTMVRRAVVEEGASEEADRPLQTSGIEVVEKNGNVQKVELNLEENKSAEVIIAAGTMNSPQLLQVSGLGKDAPELAVGGKMHRVLPGVGENLQDHLQIRKPKTPPKNVRI